MAQIMMSFERGKERVRERERIKLRVHLEIFAF